MTRKQLEQAIRLIAMFDDSAVHIATINETFGLTLTDSSTREEALTAFIEAKGIRLEATANYTATIQFGNAIMCAIQTVDPNLTVSGAVDGWGDCVLKDVSIQVTKNESEVTHG